MRAIDRGQFFSQLVQFWRSGWSCATEPASYRLLTADGQVQGAEAPVLHSEHRACVVRLS